MAACAGDAASCPWRGRRRVSVGVAVAVVDGGEWVKGAAGEEGDAFVRAIMHRPVSARLWSAEVRVSCGWREIERVLGVRGMEAVLREDGEEEEGEGAAAAAAAGGRGTPEMREVDEGGGRRAGGRPGRPGAAARAVSVDARAAGGRGAKGAKGAKPAREGSPVSSDGDGGWVSDGSGAIGRGRFGELFEVRVESSAEVRVFAGELARRLRDAGGAVEEDAGGREDGRAGAAVRRRSRPVAVARRPDAAGSEGDDEGEEGRPAGGCGFGACHDAVGVLCDGLAVVKRGKGLYRTALGAGAGAGAARAGAYFEVHVVEDCGGDGMAVGVATAAMPLDRLVGSDGRSVALHSTGKLVCGGGEFADFAAAGFAKGDRVGVSVGPRAGGARAPPASLDAGGGGAFAGDAPPAAGAPAVVRFFVNGAPVGGDVAVAVADGAALRPAVSLYRLGSKAVMRCCRQDWEAARPAVARYASFCGR